MPQMRTIDKAYEHLLSTDKDCSLTRTALRRLVVNGTIPSVRIGAKYLVSLEAIDVFLSSGSPAPQVECVNGIRRIE